MRTLPTCRRNSSGIVASASAAMASKSSRVGAVPKQGVRRGFVKIGIFPPYRRGGRSPSTPSPENVRQSLLQFGARFARSLWEEPQKNRTKLAAAHMLQFIVRRLIVALLVAATVMTLAFILTRLSGD